MQPVLTTSSQNSSSSATLLSPSQWTLAKSSSCSNTLGALPGLLGSELPRWWLWWEEEESDEEEDEVVVVASRTSISMEDWSRSASSIAWSLVTSGSTWSSWNFSFRTCVHRTNKNLASIIDQDYHKMGTHGARIADHLHIVTVHPHFSFLLTPQNLT